MAADGDQPGREAAMALASRAEALGCPPAKVAEVAEVAAPLAPKLDDEAAILLEIGAGRHHPGAIATATRLGVTRVYQLLDKMREAGRVHVAPDGHISKGGVS